MMNVIRVEAGTVGYERADTASVSARSAASKLGTSLLLAAAIGLSMCVAPLPSYAQGAKATPSGSEKSEDVSKWIGKSTAEVKAKLGKPSSTQFLQETTGWLLIYSRPGEPQYVFETGPDGKVRKVTITK